MGSHIWENFPKLIRVFYGSPNGDNVARSQKSATFLPLLTQCYHQCYHHLLLHPTFSMAQLDPLTPFLLSITPQTKFYQKSWFESNERIHASEIACVDVVLPKIYLVEKGAGLLFLHARSNPEPLRLLSIITLLQSSALC